MTSHSFGRRPDAWTSDENSDDDLCFIGVSSSKPNTSNGFVNYGNQDNWDDDWETATGDGPQISPLERIDQETDVFVKIRLCCVHNYFDKLQDVLATQPDLDINSFPGDSEESPLISACLAGNLEIIKYLIESKSADPNKKHPKSKISPLIALASCETGQEDSVIECADELINAGAIINDQDREGFTPLITSIRSRLPQLAKMLLEKGADPNLADYQGDTPLCHAVNAADGELCRRLISHGADVNITYRNGFTAVDHAQDLDLPELSNFLRICRDTKWKPGLHPSLMKIEDQDAIQQRLAKNDDVALMEDSSIQLMLEAVHGGKYLDNIRRHQISYPIFITLTDEQLIEVGVDDESVRAALLENIKRAKSAQGSLREVSTNKNMTAAEILCLVNDTKGHLELMGSHLEYLGERVKQDPMSLRFDLERNPLEKMIKLCAQTEAYTEEVDKKCNELSELLRKIMGVTEEELNGLLEERAELVEKMKKNVDKKRKKDKTQRGFRWTWAKRIVTGMGVISIGLYLGLKCFKKG